MWIERELGVTLPQLFSTRPALLLSGSRQVGKTSLLEHTFPDVPYVSLDLPSLAEQAEEDGRAFLSDHPPPVVLDEIQHAPGLFPYLKREIDLRRRARGLFLLSGSQKLPLMHGVSESLAGRMTLVELYSLSLREIGRSRAAAIDGPEIPTWIHVGGYPELVAEDLPARRFYADYVATYLERDVRQIVQVRNLRDFDRFLRLCAIRTGQLVSMNGLAADVGVSPNTIRSWLSVLEASGVIMLLPPYFRNLGKRLVKTPKLYFLDTGLACFLAGIDSTAALKQSGMLGALFETLVLGQIVRHYANRGDIASIFFYRDHHGIEVDFVLPVGNALRLVECKWAEKPQTRVRGFEDLESRVERVLSKTIVTPWRGCRTVNDVTIADCVDPTWLDLS